MIFGNFSENDTVVLTPPTVKSIARRESRRLVFSSMLVLALLSVCVLAAGKLDLAVSANFSLGMAAFLPSVF
jgi:hypothetical protein